MPTLNNEAEAAYRQIAGTALCLSERLESGCDCRAPLKDADFDRLVATWFRRVCRSSETGAAVFEEKIKPYLSAHRSVASDTATVNARQIPEWALLLVLAEQAADEPKTDGSPAQTEPFAPIWNAYTASVEGALAGMPPVFKQAAVEWIRNEVARVGLPILADRFRKFRFMTTGPGEGTRGDRAYRRFVDSFDGVAMRNLHTALPVFARQVGSRLVDGIAFATAVAARFAEDRPKLDAQFEEIRGRHPVECSFGLSDPHPGGRTAVRLVFENGFALYYKPCSLGGYGLWQQVLTHIEDRIGPVLEGEPAWFPRFLDAGTHGWMAAVPPRAAKDQGEAEAFAQRAGRLLFTLYLLGERDAHAANLVAFAGWPVPLDIECVLSPPSPVDLRPYTVARTGLLPVEERSQSGEAFSQAGLSDARALPPRYPELVVHAPCRDSMDVTVEMAGTSVNDNLPMPVSAEPDFADRVAAGFAEAYSCIVDDPGRFESSVARSSPGDLFQRVIFRGTRAYRFAASRFWYPAALKNGVVAEAELAGLLSVALKVPDRLEQALPWIHSEILQLMDGVVPIFTIKSGAVCDGLGRVIVRCDEGKSIPDLTVRVESLSPADLERQLAVIAETFRLERRLADNRIVEK